MSSNTTQPSPRRLLAAACMATILLCIVLIEVGTAVSRRLLPGAFPTRVGVEKAIDLISEADFAKFAKLASPPTMWEPHANSSADVRSCLGATFKSNYDAAGARAYRGHRADLSTVLLVGDSYTHGDEVADDDTTAAQLSMRSGIAAANLGVGGYSPLQAVLRAKSSLAKFPRARVVVLGVMFENVRRTVNGYLPAYSNDTESLFGIRPYALPGRIELVPSGAYADLAAFRKYAKSQLATDFWATPDLEFPHTLSFVRLASSKAYRLRPISKMNRAFGAQYKSDFADPTLAGALRTVVLDFFEWADTSKVTPVVIFIPQNRHDFSSAQAWIAGSAPWPHFTSNVHVMAAEGVDWSRYNQKPNGDCHPSPYGYGAIADAYAKIINGVQAKAGEAPSPKR